MKNIFFFIVFLFPLFIEAQTFEDTKKIIDDLIIQQRYNTKRENYEGYFDSKYKVIVDSVVLDSAGKMIPYFRNIIIPNKKLDSKNELKTIKYLENFMYDSVPAVRKTTIELIYSIGNKSLNKINRQRVVNDILEMSNIVFEDQLLLSFNSIDFDNKAKKQIKEIVKGKKRKIEFEIYIHDRMKGLIKMKGFQQIVADIKINDSLPEDYIRDSLVNDYEKDVYTYFYNKNYYPNLFYLCGKLYMYGFIKELEKMLEDDNYISNEKEIKYSLARMGNIQYEDELLKDYNCNYTFINTQKSAKLYIERFLNTDKLRCCDGDCYTKVPISWGAYLVLEKWILNIPNEYKIKRRDESLFTEEDKILYEKGKKWINENIVRLELNPEIIY